MTTHKLELTIARTGLGNDVFQTPDFRLAVPHRGGTKTLTAHLVRWGHEYFISNPGTMLKDSYTDADRAESARLAASAVICDGDIIEVNGERFVVKAKGVYSDPAALIAA